MAPPHLILVPKDSDAIYHLSVSYVIEAGLPIGIHPNSQELIRAIGMPGMKFNDFSTKFFRGLFSLSISRTATMNFTCSISRHQAHDTVS
jgi:hypothetical protein